jgi:hypothetical protein
MQEDTKGEKLRYENESFRIRGCMYEVNKKLGIGFLETVYQEALEIELKKAEIPYESGNNQSYSLIHPCLSVSVRGYFEIGIPEGNSTYSSGLKKTTKY